MLPPSSGGWRHNPEDRGLNLHCRGNLKSDVKDNKLMIKVLEGIQMLNHICQIRTLLYVNLNWN